MGRLRRTMVMRGPYQIHRYPYRDGWDFQLWKYESKVAVEQIASAYSKAPIPPLSLRKIQARLNTKAFIDNPRGWLEL